MSESNYLRQTLLSLSTRATVFRHNVGTGWVGQTGASGPGWVRLLNPRPLHAGLTVGGSDIIGWVPLTITPEHVGQTLAVFLACETKGPRTPATEQQLNFLHRVASDGGVAILAREGHDDAGRILDKAQTGEAVWGRVHGTLPSTSRQGCEQSLPERR